MSEQQAKRAKEMQRILANPTMEYVFDNLEQTLWHNFKTSAWFNFKERREIHRMARTLDSLKKEMVKTAKKEPLPVRKSII